MVSTLRYREAIRYEHMTASSTAIERDGEARLERVVVNDPAATTLTLHEAGDSGGAVIAVVDCNNAGTYEYGVTLSGLTAVLGGTADVTIIYQ